MTIDNTGVGVWLKLLFLMKMNSQEGTIDPDFQWGKFPAQENSFQFTRSMMEMRKLKPYEIKVPPPPGILQEETSPSKEVEIPGCPIIQHSIQLLKYIRQVKSMLKLNSWNPNEVAFQKDLLTPPPFDPPKKVFSARRSRSSSSGRSIDEDDKLRFVVPESSSKFCSGTQDVEYPSLSDDDASVILKKSIITLLAHEGFDVSSSSAINVLTGLAETFLVSFSRSLRNALDMEAETGSTPFYDCLTQALQENGNTSLDDIKTFWQDKVVKRHTDLEQQASLLSKSFKARRGPQKEDARKMAKFQQERSGAFSATYGKWTPVAGMSSSPFQSTMISNESPYNTRTHVKSEPLELTAMSNYALAGGGVVKTENTGYDFPNVNDNKELTESSSSDVYRGLIGGEFLPAKKQRL